MVSNYIPLLITIYALLLEHSTSRDRHNDIEVEWRVKCADISFSLHSNELTQIVREPSTGNFIHLILIKIFLSTSRVVTMNFLRFNDYQQRTISTTTRHKVAQIQFNRNNRQYLFCRFIVMVLTFFRFEKLDFLWRSQEKREQQWHLWLF